ESALIESEMSGNQSLILRVPSGSAGRTACLAAEPVTAWHFYHPIEHDRREGDEKQIDHEWHPFRDVRPYQHKLYPNLDEDVAEVCGVGDQAQLLEPARV